MVLHAGRRIERPGMIRTTTLCGRMNARSRDGMNIAGTGEAVTCKFCLSKLRGPVQFAVAGSVPAAALKPSPIARPAPWNCCRPSIATMAGADRKAKAW